MPEPLPWPRSHPPGVPVPGLQAPYNLASACVFCRAIELPGPDDVALICACRQPCGATRCLANHIQPGKCPTCNGVIGGMHGMSCAIYSEVIIEPGRPEPRQVVQATDTRWTSCRCPDALVRHRGRAGHLNGCPRSMWVTPTEPPARDPEPNVHHWSVSWADPGVHLTPWMLASPLPAYSTGNGFHVARGWSLWQAAADWLDGLPRRLPGVTPLGVFQDLDVQRANRYVAQLAEQKRAEVSA